MTRWDFYACAFGGALLLWCSVARADERPDVSSHRGGIVAHEVHPAPTVGPDVESPKLTKAAASDCGRGCLPDFGGGL